MANTFHKPISSIISNRKENQSTVTVNGSGLTYTLCDRTDTSSIEANYFNAFNLPYTETAFPTGSTLSLANPEVQQLNVDKVVIVPISKDNYSNIIDGRSITFKIPQDAGSGVMSYKTIISSTYSALNKKQEYPLVGKNVSFLFSDDINLPYTGTTGGGVNSYSNVTTWNATKFINRPFAKAYSDLLPSDINTDQRSSPSWAVTVPSTYPTTTDQGYNYDIPVGFVALDKGFMVLTHPDIVNNIPWVSGFTLSDGVINSGATSATTSIYFTSTTYSEASFNDIDIDYKTSVVCLALPGEFYFTTNPSWDFDKNYIEQQNGTNGYDSVYITEIGLYNKNKELIAIAKLDRPVPKTYTSIFNFNIDIDV